MAAKVFISYRRNDAMYQARLIHEMFCKVIPRDHVFMDVNSIPPGAKFRKILNDWVNQCEVLLALIGPGWIDARDSKTDGRRLDDKSDFVRIEIGEALARDIPVVPVLLDGTPLPDKDLLPDDLKELVERQAVFVEYRTFDADVERLVRGLSLRPPDPLAVEQLQAPPTPPLPAEALSVPSPPQMTPPPKVANGKAEWFKDHEMGPEMVIVPAGKFTMGSPEESPQHSVRIAQPFAVGRHAVTRGQFAAFVNNTGYKTEGGAYVWTGNEWKSDPRASWRNPGFPQDDSHPVVCVSWEDAKAFAAWLSSQSGRDYRLLTEAEWEYVARAGTMAPFWWGSSITPAQANYNGNYVYGDSGAEGEYREQTVAVGEFAANPWGLYQVHGNVWEWCEDIWHDDYNGAPSDGSAWLQQGGNADLHILRGGSWNNGPRSLRSAYRNGDPNDSRCNNIGFRLGRTLTP